MITIVVPTYNERKNMQTLLPKLLHYVTSDQSPHDGCRILVVDDSSPDGTADVVRFHQRRFPHRILLLERAKKDGLAGAYREGFALALKDSTENDCVVQMDADGSHNPDDVPRLVDALYEHKKGLVIGSRYIKGGGVQNWPKHREFLSRGGSFYARMILGLPVKDVTGGFRAWRVSALKATEFLSTNTQGYSFQIEMLHRAYQAGVPLLEVPIVFKEREEGVSKMSGNIVREAILAPWKM